MTEDKLIAVSTFCSWTSYGSMLQAYAMKRTLETLGFKSYILIDRVVATPEMKCRIPRTLNIKAVVQGILNHRLLQEINRQYQKSNQFLKDNIDIIYYNSYQEMELNYLNADFYLVGSDQVFNPDNLSPGLFFDCVQDKSKLVTYACSMGSTRVRPERENLLKKRLSGFEKISLREEDNISVLKKYNPSAIYSVHIDPTLLLSASQWREKEKAYPIKGDYILLYPLYWDDSFNLKMKKLKAKTGLKIVGVFSSGYNRVFCDEKHYDVGVDEFLWLVDHAKAVVTSSFHGAVFSMIFGKKTCIVKNPNMPSRLEELSKRFGFASCDIVDVMSMREGSDNVQQIIGEEQKRSMAYLREVLHVK